MIVILKQYNAIFYNGLMNVFQNQDNREKDIWSALQIGQMSQICIYYLGAIKQYGNIELNAISDP